MDLTNDVVAWLNGERVPMRRTDFLVEISRISTHSKLWPAATHEEWDQAIDQAIREGRVVESQGKISIATPVAVEQTTKQLGLFE